MIGLYKHWGNPGNIFSFNMMLANTLQSLLFYQTRRVSLWLSVEFNDFGTKLGILFIAEANVAV